MKTPRLPPAEFVPHDRIFGLHKVVVELHDFLSVPPMPLHITSDLDPNLLYAFLALNPIPVKSTQDGYVCIANFRLLHAARGLLPPNLEIPVRDVGAGVSNNLIKTAAMADLLYVPAILGLSPREINRQWQVAKRAGYLSEFGGNLDIARKSAFERLYGLPKGRLRKQ